MLSKLKNYLMIIAATLLAIVYLVFTSRKSGKQAQEAKQREKILEKVEQVNEIDREIDNLDSVAKRDRLRNNK